MKRFAVALAATLVCGAAGAQLTLPGAAERSAKPRRPHHAAGAPVAALAAPDPASVVDHPLKLNGREGELTLSRGDGGALRIVKYTLLGEVISRPEQKCRIDIVADAPIAAEPKGAPDGLPRFAADIAACPLTFDLADGAVIVPAQTNACAFAAADCQASPSGVWGPGAGDIDAKAVNRVRAAADRAIQDSARTLESRDAGAAAELAREETDYSAERDDTCRGYEGEARLGFCASRLTQARAALMARRAAEAGPIPASERGRKRRRGR